VRYNSTQKPSPDVTSQLGSPKSLSLSERLKKLSREYGWSALGVYLLLSALDFPFCFLAVRLFGTDRIGQVEQTVVNTFWKVVEVAFPNARHGAEQAVESAEDVVGDAIAREGGARWGVDEARARNQGEEASTCLLVGSMRRLC